MKPTHLFKVLSVKLWQKWCRKLELKKRSQRWQKGCDMTFDKAEQLREEGEE